MKTSRRIRALLALVLILSFCGTAVAAAAGHATDYGITESENVMKETKNVWPDPEYVEMKPSSLDYADGTLRYDYAADGKTVTISYDVNGETRSYTVPNKKNYLSGAFAATDDLGRSLYNSEQVGIYGENGEHYVGLFYFLWHGEHGDSGVYDLQKIIDKYGVEAAGNISCGAYGPEGAMHWFAEPLYGYYYAKDEWVMRKHAELLCNANIDFLYLDVTNGYAYIDNALQLMSLLHHLNAEGYDAPGVVFYTNSSAEKVVREVYDKIYAQNLYPDTWFCIDGKPVIVAPYSANINDFFHIKLNQWPNEGAKENGWPWMDFEWPQRIFNDENGNPSAISVSIAQHSGTICFSHSSLYGEISNRGRSYREAGNTTEFWRQYRAAYDADPSLTLYGHNFQTQWDRAVESGAEYVLVTGWNEWVAQRQPTSDGWVYFVDTASTEFSRDAEMMKGGYFDNYYMQLAYNVQRLSGASPIIVQDSRRPINVTGDFAQWDEVPVTYSDPSGDTAYRYATGFGKKTYVNETGRNDIVSSKVTSDTKNLYFLVETAEEISMYDTKSSWMQLYLNVDGQPSGFSGYDFIVNYRAKDAFTTTVAKYSGENGEFSFSEIGEIRYRVKGNQLMLAVPLSLLGIERYDEICVEFKWADSTLNYGKMADFYVHGDVAPLGRMNYVYQNYIPGVSISRPLETEAESETLPSPEENGTVSAPAVEPTGCTSALPPTSAALLAALPALMKKKKK